MPKDFAKKAAPAKKRGASRSKKNQRQAPVLLWLLACTLILGFASGLVYFKWFKTPEKPEIKPPAKAKIQEKTNVEKKTSEPKKPAEESIPLYKLHQDLINKEVKIPEEDLKLPDNINKFYYSMPCGSFRESYRAEELKAQIAMTGNNSSIESVSYQGETWYRVQLGPFSRKRAAESVRHRLQDNNIQGCIINRHLIKQ